MLDEANLVKISGKRFGREVLFAVRFLQPDFGIRPGAYPTRGRFTPIKHIKIGKEMKAKHLLLALAAIGGAFEALACTGISLTAADGSYIQSRTIEWGNSALESMYVVIPRGERLQSLTPDGQTGLSFKARYGVVGLAVVEKQFIAEGINEAGLSAGLFFFPQYGSYETYQPAQSARTLVDLEVAQWILTQFSTIDEVKAAIGGGAHRGARGQCRRALAHRRAVGPPGGAGDRRRRAALLRE